jgi:hypothetical protein
MHKSLSVPFATVLLSDVSSAIGIRNNFGLAPDAMQFGETAIDHIINTESL